MNVREMSERTELPASERTPNGPGVQSDPPGARTGRDGTTTLRVTHDVANPDLSLQSNRHYVERPENFDEWLIWLDQTCAAARRVGIESQVNHHRDQLAAWALRQIEEAA